jgi:predicted 3-demethylubiquinone-9 3-methyltransferase (glyoxalase superfamily)
VQKIVPRLWFDTESEDAAQFYTSVLPNSRIIEMTRYGSAGPRPEGMVMTVTFELDGQIPRTERPLTSSADGRLQDGVTL